MLKMKPILFNTDMVRAILNGTKTVTRQVVKPQSESFWTTLRMPYRPGDILYVRETWCKTDCFGLQNGFVYKANNNSILEQTGFVPKWRPSIHMPRDAARLFLRVTNVRVELLHEMKCSDMVKEGVIPETATGGQWQQWQRDYMNPVWDSTLKKSDLLKYGWDANPWVWVIEFERISKEEVYSDE